MAKINYIITSDCRIDGKHVAKGSTLALDMDEPKEAQKTAELNAAGRLAQPTRENSTAIQAEMDAQDKRDQKAQDKQDRTDAKK